MQLIPETSHAGLLKLDVYYARKYAPTKLVPVMPRPGSGPSANDNWESVASTWAMYPN